MNSTMQLPPRAVSRMRARPEKKLRSCLMCGRRFKSEGPHNRRCSRCEYILEHAREGTYYEPKVYTPSGGRAGVLLEID
ncbi:MAG: hypothetical protein V3V94_04650 [Candidatus Brocadiales bacterium]